jgi:hypothetical protein
MYRTHQLVTRIGLRHESRRAMAHGPRDGGLVAQRGHDEHRQMTDRAPAASRAAKNRSSPGMIRSVITRSMSLRAVDQCERGGSRRPPGARDHSLSQPRQCLRQPLAHQGVILDDEQTTQQRSF